MKFVLLRNILKKSWSPKICIRSTSWRSWNLIHSSPCRTPCRLFIHEVFFGPLGLHIRVWSALGWSPPFRPMRALRLQWSHAFGLVCEVALSAPTSSNTTMQWQGKLTKRFKKKSWLHKDLSPRVSRGRVFKLDVELSYWDTWHTWWAQIPISWTATLKAFK